MVRRIALGLVVALLLASGAQAQQQPVRKLGPDAGMFLTFVKGDKTADFEAVMAKVKEGLLKSTKPERKQQAAGWKVFKSADPPVNGNVVYVLLINPSVKDADYNVVQILIEEFPTEVQALYTKYADSLAMGQNILNLALVSDFGK